MVKEIFVNLPVRELDKSMSFFKKLGFKFDPQFTGKNAACMVMGENIFAMLLVEEFFKSFISKEISDSTKSTEVIVAISLENRNMVDEMVNLAIKAGGNEPGKPQDHGWMYSRSFEDLDGHIWEPFFADKSEFKK